MKTSSAKAKGRRLQRWVADRICHLLFDRDCQGYDDEVAPREMGQAGSDIRVASERAVIGWPFSVECKSGKSWSLPAAIKQAKSNIRRDYKADFLPKDLQWIVFLKRDRERPVVCLDAEVFFAILNRVEFSLIVRSTNTTEFWRMIAWDLEHKERDSAEENQDQ